MLYLQVLWKIALKIGEGKLKEDPINPLGYKNCQNRIWGKFKIGMIRVNRNMRLLILICIKFTLWEWMALKIKLTILWVHFMSWRYVQSAHSSIAKFWREFVEHLSNVCMYITPIYTLNITSWSTQSLIQPTERSKTTEISIVMDSLLPDELVARNHRDYSLLKWS